MKNGAPRAGKGSAWERECARQLSLWLTHAERTDELVRSKGSGAWETQKGDAASWRHAGDLAPNGPAGEIFRQRFVVECKHRAAIDFWHVYTAKPSDTNIHGWWEKLCAEAAQHRLEPMLIIKANNRPPLVGLRSSGAYCRGSVKVIEFPWLDLTFIPLTDFLSKPPCWRTGE